MAREIVNCILLANKYSLKSSEKDGLSAALHLLYGDKLDEYFKDSNLKKDVDGYIGKYVQELHFGKDSVR
jgi:hypothetical protein